MTDERPSEEPPRDRPPEPGEEAEPADVEMPANAEEAPRPEPVATDVGDAPGPYSAAEADAQAAKRGVWRGSFEKPFDWRQANPREGD